MIKDSKYKNKYFTIENPIQLNALNKDYAYYVVDNYP